MRKSIRPESSFILCIFDSFLDSTVELDLDIIHLGGLNLVSFGPEAELKIDERVLSTIASEARISRLLFSLDPPEERLPEQVNSLPDVL